MDKFQLIRVHQILYIWRKWGLVRVGIMPLGQLVEEFYQGRGCILNTLLFRANELVQEHEDIERTIDMTNPEVAKIIDTHRRWLSGHLVWVLESGRYSSPTSCFSFLRSAPSSREVSLSPASQMTQREE